MKAKSKTKSRRFLRIALLMILLFDCLRALRLQNTTPPLPKDQPKRAVAKPASKGSLQKTKAPVPKKALLSKGKPVTKSQSLKKAGKKAKVVKKKISSIVKGQHPKKGMMKVISPKKTLKAVKKEVAKQSKVVGGKVGKGNMKPAVDQNFHKEQAQIKKINDEIRKTNRELEKKLKLLQGKMAATQKVLGKFTENKVREKINIEFGKLLDRVHYEGELVVKVLKQKEPIPINVYSELKHNAFGKRLVRKTIHDTLGSVKPKKKKKGEQASKQGDSKVKAASV